MFRSFSRPIVSISQNVSAFYVRYSRTKSVGQTIISLRDVHLTAAIGITKTLFDYTHLGLKYVYNRHWIKINNNDVIFLEAEKLDDSIDDEQDDDCFDEDIYLTNRDIVSLQQKSYKWFLHLPSFCVY
jgi:hypothetical protein